MDIPLDATVVEALLAFGVFFTDHSTLSSPLLYLSLIALIYWGGY